MKNFIILVCSLISVILVSSSFALDSAKLRVKISGSVSNKYFLCVSQVGCVSIAAGNKGKIFPINHGNVKNIFTMNAAKLRMHTQSLPSSCDIIINNKNQTLTVTGKLIEGPNNKVTLSNLRCTLT